MTKSLIIFLLAMLMGAQAQAKNSMIGNFGMTQGRLIIGAEFESRSKKSHALAAHVVMKTADEDNGAYRQLLIGGAIKVFFGTGRWQLYMGPGIGLGMMDIRAFDGTNVATTETQTLFGPTLNVGAYYRFSKKLSFGLDHRQFFNWFSDHAGVFEQYNFVTAAVRYSF